MDFTTLNLFGAPLREHKVWVNYEGPKVFALRSVDYGFFYIVNAVAEDDDGDWMTFLAAPQSADRFAAIDSGRDSFRSAFTEPAGGRLYELTWRWGDEGWLPEVEQVAAAEVREQWLPRPGAYLRGKQTTAQEVQPYHRGELLDFAKKKNRTAFALKVVPAETTSTEFPALQSGKLQVAVQRQLDALAAEQGGGYKARFDVEASVTGQRAASYVMTFAINKGQSLVERTDLTDRVFSDLAVMLAHASENDRDALLAVFDQHTIRTRLRFRDLLEPLAETGSALRFDTAMYTDNEVRSVEVSAQAIALTFDLLEHPDKTVRYVELERATLLGSDVHTLSFDIFDNASGVRYVGSMTEDARTQADGLAVGAHSYVSAVLRVEYEYKEDERAGVRHILEQVEAWEPGRSRSDGEPDAVSPSTSAED